MAKHILFGKWGDYWRPPFPIRLFYRLKALICLLLNREPDGKVNMYDYTHVLLTYTDGGQGGHEYTVYWFEAIGVGGGLFRDWWVTYFEGSSD